MATYSINIGTPTESTKVQDLQTFLNKLPDNTAQLISPRDARDSIFTTWENILIKETTVGSSSIGYIGLDNDALKAKMFIGKKAYTSQEILDNTLLSSDTDLFIFNGKSDSNPTLQDTKVSFLAGLIPGDYYYAPYIEATKITSPSRIDLALVNPATAGVIEINADQVELGNNGWVINSTGALYPVIDGQDLGATPSNRIGNLFMSSRIDYASDLNWTVGTTSNMVLTTGGILSVDSISASNIFTNDLQVTTSATAGYVLTSDGIGNAIWSDVSVTSPGVTAGYIIVANGSGATTWQQNTSLGAGADGSVQFSQGGVLAADNNNFFWNNSSKKLGLNTNVPIATLDVIGSGSFSSSVSIGGTVSIDNGLTVGNTLVTGATISTTGVDTGNLIATSVQLGVSGATAGRILTATDALGNATWQNAPITVTASGLNGAIQLSDGSQNFIDDTSFKWDNTYNNLLKIDNTNNVLSNIGSGIQNGGSFMLENTNTFIGWNTYDDVGGGTGFKRFATDYSSYITQDASGSLGIFVGDSGSASGTPAIWEVRGVNITSTGGYNNNGGFEQFTTDFPHGLSGTDVVRITGIVFGIDGIKTVTSIDSTTQFTTNTSYTVPTVVPGGATVELFDKTSAIEIDNTNKNVGIGISPIRDLHVNKHMRFEPTTEPPATPGSGDVYFDDTLNSLMVHDGSAWFKSESKLLKSINSEEMYTQSGTFLGVARSTTGDFITQDRWKMRSFNNTTNGRVAQFNFVLPETYIADRGIRLKIKWTINEFVAVNGTVIFQFGVTEGPYFNNDTSMQYFNGILFIAGGQFHNLPDNTFTTPTYTGTGWVPGTPISVAMFRNNGDSFNGTIYISNIEVEMV